MDIQETRRARLRLWLEGKTAPTKEKSYFSQLLGGTTSFGERAARRLERDYGMGDGYLDSPLSTEVHVKTFVKNQQTEIASTKNEVARSPAPTYNVPHAGDNFELGPDIKPRRYPEISWIQAGMWTELCDNFQPDESTIWHQCHIDLGPCGFVVTVRGPSMTAPAGVTPSFPDGIKLFVQADAEALPGKYVIVARDGKATFKKLSQVDSELYLEALNPEWPERYQRVQEGDRFIGMIRHAGFDL